MEAHARVNVPHGASHRKYLASKDSSLTNRLESGVAFDTLDTRHDQHTASHAIASASLKQTRLRESCAGEGCV
jgi:hypothetical protein